MPWMDCICCVWVVCLKLSGLNVVLCHCRGVHVSDGKVAGLPFQTHDGVGFHPTGRWHYIRCLYQGGGPQSLTLTLCSLDHFTMGWFTCLSEYD